MTHSQAIHMRIGRASWTRQA